MHDFVQQAQHAMTVDDPQHVALRALQHRMADFTDQTQAIGTSADLMASLFMEQQINNMLQQNQQIIGLTAALLVFLMISAGALLHRNRAHLFEKAALEALNKQLRQAQQDAEAGSRGKSLFLANMSHELRTPFNGIVGILSLLGNTPLSAQQADLVKTVNDSAGHFLKLLNDILDMSAMESGKLHMQNEAVELRSLMLEVKAIMRPLAMQKQLAFDVQGLPDQALWIKSDATRLRQILLNLLNNAIKFTERGQVVLGLKTHTYENNPALVEFSIQDTGIGMEPTVLGKLFQRFYQVDAGLSRQFSGAGLGLEISMSLARLLGGDIQVRSQPAVGSTFVLRMPWVPYQPLSPTAVINTASDKTKPPTPTNLRILVAEDHPVNQKFLSVLLQRMGHQAKFCENGQLALQALSEEEFDVVLMDIHMPVMDGLEATRCIRALPCRKSRIPVIALTADVFKEARDSAAAVGVNAFIPKPVQINELQLALQTHVVPTNRNQSQPEMAHA
ncbi:MAG: ATP-binding protein [Limnohabitans sp.]